MPSRANMNTDMNKTRLAFLVKNDLLAETMLVQMQKQGFNTSIHHTVHALEHQTERHEAPDILVIDLDAFGMEILKTMTVSSTEKNTEIIALSRKNTMEKRLQAVHVNASAFITKPFDAKDLTDQIHACLQTTLSKPKTVLIIDDDPSVFSLCQKILESNNIRARFLHDALIALREIEHNQPDLILMDYYMPHANGADIYNVIRQIYTAQDLPVLFMTGVENPDILSNLIELSDLGVLKKPLNHSEFTNRVSSALNL